ncbi:hypothetical protein C8R43DRAFT_1211126 [Mycena crocata]|nr:hypothetical protein C8R43DRAFT_1211126 [Mycena crocata]
MPTDVSTESAISLSGATPSSQQGETSVNGFSHRPDLERRTFPSKLVGPAVIVICGQLLLQILAWGFYGAIWSRGFIAIPFVGIPPAIIWFQPLKWLCTQVSTGLSLCSSFLFSWGVRQAITLHLHGDGMSFATLMSNVKISSRSLMYDPKQRKWTALSIAVFGLTASQTAGWSSLLTPQVVPFDVQLTGRELDLTNPLLETMLDSDVLNNCVVDSSNLPAFTVGQPESGYAAVNAYLELPVSLTLMDQTFSTSTAGILPLTFYDVDASSWFPAQTITARTLPGTLSPTIEIRNALSASYSLHQQGFTADVHCEFQVLTPDTTPSLIIQKKLISNNDAEAPILSITASSNCTGPVPNVNTSTVNVLSTDGSGAVVMVACGGSAGSYSTSPQIQLAYNSNGEEALIFVGSGLYEFVNSTVCTLSPRIISVQVDYSFLSGLATIATTRRDTVSLDFGGPTALNAITTISNMMYFAQGGQTNIFGEQLNSLPKNVLLGPVMEQYIRCVAEYSGSVFRGCLSVKNGTVFNGTANMTLLDTGLYHSQLVGWELSISTFWVLIPGALVALATIYIVLRSVALDRSNPTAELVFDIANPMHVIPGAAAGGLRDVFSGSQEKDINSANDVDVVLGTVEGFRGLALKRRH